MTDENKTNSESANDVKEIKDMILQLRTDVSYLYGLLETVVERINLGHKSKSDLQEVMKLNSQFIEGIIRGKNFNGKDQLKNIINKLDSMGDNNEQ